MRAKKNIEGSRLQTRDDVVRLINLYHALHHIPWYRKLWRTLTKKRS